MWGEKGESLQPKTSKEQQQLCMGATDTRAEELWGFIQVSTVDGYCPLPCVSHHCSRLILGPVTQVSVVSFAPVLFLFLASPGLHPGQQQWQVYAEA